MRKSSIATAAALAVAALAVMGCSQQQVAQVQTTQTDVQAAVQTACTDVNAAAALAAPFSAIPEVGGALVYATASCATADAVAAMATKAVDDPTTIAWLDNLASEIKAAVPASSSAARLPQRG
jgi:hypothetical protein